MRTIVSFILGVLVFGECFIPLAFAAPVWFRRQGPLVDPYWPANRGTPPPFAAGAQAMNLWLDKRHRDLIRDHNDRLARRDDAVLREVAPSPLSLPHLEIDVEIEKDTDLKKKALTHFTKLWRHAVKAGSKAKNFFKGLWDWFVTNVWGFWSKDKNDEIEAKKKKIDAWLAKEDREFRSDESVYGSADEGDISSTSTTPDWREFVTDMASADQQLLEEHKVWEEMAEAKRLFPTSSQDDKYGYAVNKAEQPPPPYTEMENQAPALGAPGPASRVPGYASAPAIGQAAKESRRRKGKMRADSPISQSAPAYLPDLVLDKPILPQGAVTEDTNAKKSSKPTSSRENAKKSSKPTSSSSKPTSSRENAKKSSKPVSSKENAQKSSKPSSSQETPTGSAAPAAKSAPVITITEAPNEQNPSKPTSSQETRGGLDVPAVESAPVISGPSSTDAQKSEQAQKNVGGLWQPPSSTDAQTNDQAPKNVGGLWQFPALPETPGSQDSKPKIPSVGEHPHYDAIMKFYGDKHHNPEKNLEELGKDATEAERRLASINAVPVKVPEGVPPLSIELPDNNHPLPFRLTGALMASTALGYMYDKGGYRPEEMKMVMDKAAEVALTPRPKRNWFTRMICPGSDNC